MIYICKPARVCIYNNTAGKTAAKIKAETGCDALINGGLFNMSTFKATGNLKANGIEVSREWDAAQGYSWSGGEIPRFGWGDMKENDNFIGCVAMVENGVAITPLKYPTDMGGARQRTAFGTFADGRVWLYASKTSTTPEQLQALAISEGVRDAVMLDGGGSTQGISPTETVSATRIVNHYICVWKDNNMTEKEMREKVVSTAKKWIGYSEASGKHKTIIDLYNNHTPLAVGYKVKYTDAWCATFVSAVFIAAGLTEIAATECSCPRMIELYKAKNRWVENDAYVPSIGDIIMYDWQDSGAGDNTGVADHVGIVASVTGNSLQIIEGNYNESVGYRTFSVNEKYIRGYCLPDYGNKIEAATESKAEEKPQAANKVTITLNVLKNGSEGENVKALQILLKGKGYNCGTADGVFGAKTQAAVRSFQVGNRLSVDGVVGAATWAALLK